MQLGIRLHDVNASAPEAEQTLESRARRAREEGFCCVHLALSKCIGKYQIIKKIGEGSYAKIYKVKKDSSDKPNPYSSSIINELLS